MQERERERESKSHTSFWSATVPTCYRFIKGRNQQRFKLYHACSVTPPPKSSLPTLLSVYFFFHICFPLLFIFPLSSLPSPSPSSHLQLFFTPISFQCRGDTNRIKRFTAAQHEEDEGRPPVPSQVSQYTHQHKLLLSPLMK